MSESMDRLRRIAGDKVADACQRGIDTANRDWNLYQNDTIYHNFVDWAASLVKGGHLKREDLPGAIEIALAMVDADSD